MNTSPSPPFWQTLLPVVLITIPAFSHELEVREDSKAQTIEIYRHGEKEPILTQNVRADFRPYIHPIVAPDGNGVLTEYSPGHHKHQTGLYWGFTNVNGRDYFHHPEGKYWKKISSKVLTDEGETVEWETVYDLLSARGKTVLRETQHWSMEDLDDHYVLELEWTGEAVQAVKVGAYDYGGLFLRMPWRQGSEGTVITGARHRDMRAEGQRAIWLNVGMEIEGRDDFANIAILDHPKNPGFPQPWRVDNQFGVGPVYARLGDWEIEKGKSVTFRHQIIAYTGEFKDSLVSGSWTDFTGHDKAHAQWNLARQEAKTAKFLTGEQAIEKMTMQDGFETKLYVSEPTITQPMAFCWDDRGRMWIAENRDYESRGDGFSNSGDSRILILEDTDGDGTADSRKVFLEGIPFPAAIAVGHSGLWLGAPPNLLFVPDRDGDDKADMEDIELRLTGWGIKDRHETLNSLSWGPDGWLYGCQGLFTTSRVGKPQEEHRVFKPGEPFPEDFEVEGGQLIDGGVWRYHPSKDRFEVVAHGFSNPWGLDFDDHGQIFITACVIPHLWYVIPGGVYHRQGGTHINPYVYSDIQTIVDHRHRSAHGGARIYLADAFPETYHGRMFMANIHEHAVLTDTLTPKGSGFVASHGDDFLLANDPQWVGFSVEIGPEGAVYVLDWHDADICGTEVLYKDTGRVFRIAPDGLKGKTDFNLKDLSDADLVQMQLHTNDWYVRRARLILQERALTGDLDPQTYNQLWELFETQTDDGRKLRALWALHVTGGVSNSQLLTLLEHEAPYIRGWAIQLLCEDRDPDQVALDKFLAMTERDPSPVVRLYLASALQRIPEANVLPLALQLVQHEEDAEDHNLPKMIWYGVEPQVAGSPEAAFDLALKSELPLVSNFISRRTAAEGNLEFIVEALSKTEDADLQFELLEGMRDGLRGIRGIEMPEKWPALRSQLAAVDHGGVRDLTNQLDQMLGSDAATNEMLTRLEDPKTPLAQRQEILRSMAESGIKEVVPLAVDLFEEETIQVDALRAVAAFGDPDIAEEILMAYNDLTQAGKLEAVQTLASRQNFAIALLDALKEGGIPREDIPAHVARQLRRVLGPTFVDYWGSMTELSEDKEKSMAKYKALLTPEFVAAADLPNGRAIFDRTCGACHKMYDSGGILGPDITGSNRANLDYILENMINPSGEIPEGYQLVIVTTRDGRTLSGMIASEDSQQLTLRLVGQEFVVAKSEILSREVSPVSMMPEGLLATLDDEDVRDLIAYLRTMKQVDVK